LTKTIGAAYGVLWFASEPDHNRTRRSVIQRSFAHDISHITELSEVLSGAGLPIVDLWD